MGGNQDDLSHEEVWDDSALIDSWNEALQEYKVDPFSPSSLQLTNATIQKYHSIHAKGGSVRDLEPKNRSVPFPVKQRHATETLSSLQDHTQAGN